jgi:hypothetical protein
MMNQAKEFLIKSTIEAFNHQTKESYDYNDFEIISIDKNNSCEAAYEIYCLIPDSEVRIRIYCNRDVSVKFSTFVLADVANSALGLDSLMYVSACTFHDTFFFISRNEYRRDWPYFASPLAGEPIILNENLIEGILTESGDPILLESAVV